MKSILLIFTLFFSTSSFANNGTYTQKQLLSYLTNGSAVSAEMMQTLERHFRDSNKFYPDPHLLKKFGPPRSRIIEGSNFIMTPLLPWSYKFDVFTDAQGVVVLRTKIHFKNVTKQELAKMKILVAAAEDIWNKGVVDVLAYKYRFQFDVMKNSESAYFSVGLLDNTRGPFYQNWSRTWDEVSVAHEIGHMFGLSDEYNEMPGTKTLGCDIYSLMCNGYWGTPKGFHYYHIIRKMLN